MNRTFLPQNANNRYFHCTHTHTQCEVIWPITVGALLWCLPHQTKSMFRNQTNSVAATGVTSFGHSCSSDTAGSGPHMPPPPTHRDTLTQLHRAETMFKVSRGKTQKNQTTFLSTVSAILNLCLKHYIRLSKPKVFVVQIYSHSFRKSLWLSSSVYVFTAAVFVCLGLNPEQQLCMSGMQT